MIPTSDTKESSTLSRVQARLTGMVGLSMGEVHDSAPVSGPLPLPDWLGVACALATTLESVHQRSVHHRGIRPDLVRIQADGQVLLAGFEQACTAAQEMPGFIHHQQLAGSLIYGAPEQTGRSGLCIDHRADLYALGATLYALACGRPPFEAADPLKLIHQHLAVQPEPLHMRVPGFPKAASDVVLHLLEKSPDQRYQSALGLKLDLQTLTARCAKGQHLDNEPFTPGLSDFPEWLAPPARLAGRAQELATLADALDRAMDGQCRGVMVAGAPGVGKTTLINTLRPLVTARRGWFVCGKFDQFRQDEDTDAVRQALRALGRLVLAEPEAELADMRHAIAQTLGPLATLISPMVPELGVLLGEHPWTATDSPPGVPSDALLAESQLIQCVVEILRVIVSPARPVVMVIDDLQWAAAPALRLLGTLWSDKQLDGLLIVGAYRAEAVDATHPLQACVQRWRQAPVPPVHMVLDNLPPDDLSTMVAGMLRLPQDRARALASEIAHRTGGNPFDTVELINALRHDGVLTPSDQGWQWREQDIHRHVGRGEVLSLLQARMRDLPEGSQHLLCAMACLGGEVTLDILSAATGWHQPTVEQHAEAALDKGLLIKRDEGSPALMFRHDRVQQAAHALLEAHATSAMHLAMARRLASDPAWSPLAAEQYLQATTLVIDPQERLTVASMFLASAQRLRLIQHHMVERFTGAALALLVASTIDPVAQRLCFDLSCERHLALYNLGQLDEADAIFEQLHTCPVELHTLVDAACLQMSSLTHRARGPEAVNLGKQMLHRLDNPVPSDLQATIATGLDLLESAGTLKQAPCDPGLMDAPDARLTSIAKVLDRLVIPTIQCDHTLNAWLATETWRLWTQYGPSAPLIRAAALSIPLVLMSRRQAYRAAHWLAEHALQVGQTRGYELATATARHVYAIGSQHWLGPLEDSIGQARTAHEDLLRGGDLQFACLTFHATLPAVLDTATTLQVPANETQAGLSFAARTGNQFALALYSTYRQLVRALQRPAPASEQGEAIHGTFQDVDFDEQSRWSGRLASGTMGAVFHVLRALSAALYGDTARLQAHTEAVMPMLGAIPGFYPTAWAHALRALALAEQLKAYPRSPDAQAELAHCLRWLQARAQDQSGNYAHLVTWIEAEHAWAQGEGLLAMRLFDQALNAPSLKTRPWHRAFITERTGLCQLAQGLTSTGLQQLRQAQLAYQQWGAPAKAQHLQDQYPALNSPEAPSTTVPGATPTQDLDLLAVIRASQLLSSETSLPHLAERTAELMAAMTGATGVQLLLRRETAPHWQRLHQASPTAPEAKLTPELFDDQCQAHVPMSALRYAERTLQALLVPDAVHDDRFAHDPYLASLPQCALLMLPVLKQGQLKAMLVLENRLATNSFAPDRLQAVQLVAAQLAVSLENAQVYNELEQRVQARTQELIQTQAKLLDTARQAGMAEIATNVLHNVGNVLNSVNVSADMIGSRLRNSKASGFGKAVQLINEHESDLGTFFTADDKGKRLPGYLNKLVQTVLGEHAEVMCELDQLIKRIDHIKEIVATQQSYAGTANVCSPVQIDSLLQDALQMNEASMTRHRVKVVLQCSPTPVMLLDRPRVLQILMNLLSNAKHACSGMAVDIPLIYLRVARQADRLHIEVQDNGCGIAPENLTRVFAHGFTTRKDGHGFGLHSCVLAAQDMGGTLVARSDGPGLGACFKLDIPAPTVGQPSAQAVKLS